ncbi:kinase phosphorylation protein-domain-containing protein [Tuber brumale]|nr:kinase phosphorylation protein-domain-containing protein [Tuber brumale]
MDLLSGLRKGDSSRGGRAEFKWEDVKEDKDRENYLGHSLMAPVGRWQKNKDLTWYAKSGAGETSAEEARKEEIRMIKEAEQDALSEALGFKAVKRPMDPVDQGEVKRAIRESGNDEEEGKGVGFGKRTGKNIHNGASGGWDEGGGVKGEFRPAEKERWRERSGRRERSRSRGRREWSRSRDKDSGDSHRHRDRDRVGVRVRRQRSRTRSRDRRWHRRDNEDRDRRRRRRSRSRTPRRDDDRGHSRR